MKLLALISTFPLTCLAFSAAPAHADPSSNMCTVESCKVGTNAVTFSSKTEPYYGCGSREIAEYVSSVIGLVAISAQFGSLPNISDKTGEPELKGESKTFLDNLRDRAGVRTFDEALTSCTMGKTGRKVVILNIPEHMMAAYVQDLRANTTFWMPISSLNKLH